MKARDIMTEHAHVVTPTDPVTHAAALMRDNNIGFIPVVHDRASRRLLGVITDRDITIRHVAAAHEEACRVDQHMTHEVATVSPDVEIADVHKLMRDRQIRRVPVVDTDGCILGVIAQADVAVKEGDPARAGETVADISEPAQPDR